MTKKKRELIEILLDNVKPEDWPEKAVYAAQDKYTSNWGKRVLMFYTDHEVPHVEDNKDHFCGEKIGKTITLNELCKHWNKTIVHRDEFMKRWNERNQSVDTEGWIQWNGGEMPVEKGTLVDVKYRNGEVNLHVSAGFPPVYNGSMPGKYACGWHSSESKYSIVAYRLHVTQEQKTPQQLALEKFGTEWHENEGAQPVNDKVLIDLIMCNGDEKKKYLANHWSWHKNQALKIKKWRIHSDEKESQASEKEKKLEWLSQPMPLFGEEIPCHFVDAKSPLETQIGGDHYTKLAIQPMRYSMENGLDALQHTVIKYVTRFRDKAGIEDLEKAKHCIDMLIEFEKENK